MEFLTDATGTPSLRVEQAKLNVSRKIVFADQQVALTNLIQEIVFDDPTKTNAPFGEIVFQDLTFLPGTVTFNFFGHEVELSAPRADHRQAGARLEKRRADFGHRPRQISAAEKEIGLFVEQKGLPPFREIRQILRINLFDLIQWLVLFDRGQNRLIDQQTIHFLQSKLLRIPAVQIFAMLIPISTTSQ